MIDDFMQIASGFVNHQRNSLSKIQNIAKKVKEFNHIQISSSAEINIENFKFTKVLYYFTLDENERFSGIEICERISQEKKKDKESKLPKVNLNNAIRNNKILYVGKSFVDFSGRMKQHFGDSKVYALHLNKWEDMFGREIKLNLYYISLEELINKDEDHLLELLESALHFKLKPILGRTGH